MRGVVESRLLVARWLWGGERGEFFIFPGLLRRCVAKRCQPLESIPPQTARGQWQEPPPSRRVFFSNLLRCTHRRPVLMKFDRQVNSGIKIGLMVYATESYAHPSK